MSELSQLFFVFVEKYSFMMNGFVFWMNFCASNLFFVKFFFLPIFSSVHFFGITRIYFRLSSIWGKYFSFFFTLFCYFVMIRYYSKIIPGRWNILWHLFWQISFEINESRVRVHTHEAHAIHPIKRDDVYSNRKCVHSSMTRKVVLWQNTIFFVFCWVFFLLVKFAQVKHICHDNKINWPWWMVKRIVIWLRWNWTRA